MSVSEIARSLLDGRVAIVPTDTVYGLGASPSSPEAIGALFGLKDRSRDKAIPVLGDGVGSLEQVAEFDERSRALVERFWPGPLTLVLARSRGFDADLGGGQSETVAVRVPARRVTLELLGLTGPLAVTSANLSGQAPCRDALQAAALWPDLPVLDDGPAGSQPSTIVSLVGAPEILRVGALPAQEVLAVVGA